MCCLLCACVVNQHGAANELCGALSWLLAINPWWDTNFGENSTPFTCIACLSNAFLSHSRVIHSDVCLAQTNPANKNGQRIYDSTASVVRLTIRYNKTDHNCLIIILSFIILSGNALASFTSSRVDVSMLTVNYHGKQWIPRARQWHYK